MIPSSGEPRPWFRAKRHGYGAGLPIAWQGWALMLAYVGVIAGLSAIFARTAGSPNWAALVGIVLATLLFLWIAAGRTEGGWAWRSGGEEAPHDPPQRGRRRRRRD